MIPTTTDKLEVLERLITDYRWARGMDPHTRGAAFAYVTLKAIAADVRARMDSAPTVADVELQRRVDAVVASKTAVGYDGGRLAALATEVLNRWPVVKQALELLERDNRLRGVLATTRTFINDQMIAHALVPITGVPEDRWPSLISIVDDALGVVREPREERPADDCCPDCGYQHSASDGCPRVAG